MFFQDKCRDERCRFGFVHKLKSGGIKRAHPTGSRMEMEESDGVSQKIIPVAQVLCDDDFSVIRQHPPKLRKKRCALCAIADFMRSQEGEDCIE
jgi:hypothetical protein